MVYELGIKIARAWYRLQKEHGVIGLQTTSDGKVRIQLEDMRVFNGLQGVAEVSTYESNGTTWRQSTKTFGAVKYLILQVVYD